MIKQGNSTKGTNMKRMKGITGKIVAVLLTVAMLVPITPSETHAEIFYLQTGRRLDTDFYANYYPDLKAKYGYNAHKLLDHYINYGIFERRIPSMYYLNNMDALGIGEFVPKEILYQRKSLRKGCSEAQFFNAYDEARYFVCVPAKNAAPNNMYAQMGVVAQKLFDRVNYNPGVKYKTKGEHYNDPCGVFGNVNKAGIYRIPYGADCAGATRAVGLCLNILCIPYEHVNENKWKQQWCRVNINGKHYVIDPYVSPYVMEETYYVRLYPPYML